MKVLMVKQRANTHTNKLLYTYILFSNLQKLGSIWQIKCQDMKEEINMKYVCDVCGWVYDESIGDPANGIMQGTRFEDLPDEFTCPLCYVGKEEFSEVEE